MSSLARYPTAQASERSTYQLLMLKEKRSLENVGAFN